MRLGNRFLALLLRQILAACDKDTGHITGVYGRPPVAGLQRGVMLDAEHGKNVLSDRMQRNTVVGPVGWYKCVFCSLCVHGDT